MSLEKLKELAITNALTDAYLLLEDAKQLKASLALELQAAKDDRKVQHKEFQDFMAELWEALASIQARFRVDATLLNLVKPIQTGEADNDSAIKPGKLGLQ